MKKCIALNETTTVCCVCGGHINGPWPAARDVSHGYCKFHHQVAMQEVQKYFALLDRKHGGEVYARAA